jgi:hypothetical protein
LKLATTRPPEYSSMVCGDEYASRRAHSASVHEANVIASNAKIINRIATS